MNLGPETEYVEHKETTRELDAACASIAAMLNKHGRGAVFFGVRDDGEVKGMDIGKTTLRDVTQRIAQRVEPGISPTVEPLIADNGKAYIRVTFEGSDGPYSSAGRYRVRIHDEDRLMTASQVEESFRARANRREPWDGRASGRPVSDVADGIVARYVAKGNGCGRIRGSYSTDADTLSRLGLVASDGTLSNAAVVLFCSDLVNIRLSMGVLAGNDKVNILDLRHESGPVFDLIDVAEFYVFSNIRRRLVISSGAREEIPEIPRDAVREAITNAFCHRDWESIQTVEVNIYMDSVEVSNPGLFPPGDTPERHLSGESVSSECRNPLIAETLFRAGVIERYGSGIMRIKGACDGAGTPFAYAQRAGRTSVSFERVGAVASAPSALFPKPSALLSVAAERTLAEMCARGSLTSDEVASVLGVGRRQAQRVLGELRVAGLAASTRSGNITTWRALV